MTRMRIAIGLITAAALVLLFVLVRPGGDDNGNETTATPTATTTATATTPPVAKPATPAAVVWRVNASEGSIARRSVTKGTLVRLIVSANEAEEVHVHGYDLKRDVSPSTPARIRFRADIPGRFEIELEHAGKQIAELTVTP